MRRAGAGNAREDRGSVGCRDAASGLYLDWASHVMSLHHSLHCYLHVALRADIANYLSFWETVSMSCLGCRLGSSNGRREQPRSSPPAEAACACACACNCARICRACACACARVPSLDYCLRCPHVLGPGGWEATRPPNHQRPPMRVIRHTVSRPLLLDPFDPSTSTTTKHMDTCARQTARQHGDFSCSVAAGWQQDLRHGGEMMPTLPSQPTVRFDGTKRQAIIPRFRFQHRSQAKDEDGYSREPALHSTP